METILLHKRFNFHDDAVKWANGLIGNSVPGRKGYVAEAIIQFQFECYEHSVELAVLVRIRVWSP